MAGRGKNQPRPSAGAIDRGGRLRHTGPARPPGSGVATRPAGRTGRTLMTRRRRDRVPTRAYVVRSLAVCAALHLALNVLLEAARPAAYDPEYGDRLAA